MQIAGPLQPVHEQREHGLNAHHADGARVFVLAPSHEADVEVLLHLRRRVDQLVAQLRYRVKSWRAVLALPRARQTCFGRCQRPHEQLLTQNGDACSARRTARCSWTRNADSSLAYCASSRRCSSTLASRSAPTMCEGEARRGDCRCCSPSPWAGKTRGAAANGDQDDEDDVWEVRAFLAQYTGHCAS